MKVIDLLNKIANGEEVPNFKYYDRILTWNSEFKWFDDVDDGLYCKSTYDFGELNEEIEIIEEDKEIEELDFYKITDETISGLRKSINILNNEYVDKINELIKAANELKNTKK